MNRSYQKELLDGNDIPFADIRQNMLELDFINSRLGGHAITIQGFKRLLQNKKQVTVCEIGCGGGDNLHAIYKWCRKNQIAVQLIGVDINKDCIRVAHEKLPEAITQLITVDYREAAFGGNKPDIIFSSLFCHHFSEEALLDMLNWMHAHAGTGFFINDLHRHVLAYHAIKILTGIFSKSYLVKNDAPLSVQRGLVKEEWKDLLEKSAAADYSIEWKWAFRWLIISRHA
ncbi:MAG: methyltransferase domain-containing protein [Chitinophagaceae bacterium]